MRLVQGSVLGIVCLAAALGGCRDKIDRDGNEQRSSRDRSGAGDRIGTTTVTGANVGGLSNDLAVERVVAARCARETACNNIGSDKHFTDYDVCARQLRTKIGEDLKSSECTQGIDTTELDECLDSIRTESCNNPIDTISRLAACRTSGICMGANSKNR